MSGLRVAVAGGGLAGMALAHHLHRHGIDVVLYERDADLVTRSPGYRLHINSTGTTALSAVLDPRLRELFVATAGIPRQESLHFDDQLNRLPARDTSASVGIGNTATDIPEHLVADRSTMRRILYTGLEEVVRFGAQVTGYQQGDDAGVTVYLADGGTAEADVLVGADGVRSAVRTRLLPDAEAIDLGVRQIAAKIPLTDATRSRIPEELHSTFTVIGNGRHDVVTFAPLNRSDPASPLIAERDQAFQDEAARDFALGIFSTPADRMPADAELYGASPAALRDLVLERIASWHPVVGELVRMWDLDTVQPLVLRSSVPTPPWKPGNVTVVGDSVHAMSPALGIGANTALRDAWLLGTELLAAAAGEKPLLSAIGDYEDAMRGYAFKAVRAAAAMGQRVMGHRGLPS